MGRFLVLLLLSVTTPLQATEPQLIFEAPAQLESTAARLQAADRQPIERILDLLGMPQVGGPIYIQLAAEGSPAAVSAPSWVLGYAFGAASQIVLLPERVPGYPHRTLEEVLYHEISHVLAARAAGRHPIPRWFDEGLAVLGSRGWGFDSRRRVLLASFRRQYRNMARVEQMFYEDQLSADRAYALSTAFVRHLVRRYGRHAPADILARVAAGESFPTAFQQATGYPLHLVERGFWRDLALWNRWVPVLSSSFTLWFGITALALWAFRRRHQLNLEQQAKWEAEEAALLEAESSDQWVH